MNYELIDNIQSPSSKFDILKPIEDHQSQEIADYKDQINEQVDRYIQSKGFSRGEDY